MVSTLTNRSSDAYNNSDGEFIQATNNGDEEENIQFSLQHECPVTKTPPTLGVTFFSHPQVFEYSTLYRHIATRESFTKLYSIFDPNTCQGIPKDEALNHVN